MFTFVFDADALIKLTKAGILPMITSHIRCLVPHQVLAETLAAKHKLLEDAMMIENLVNEGKIEVSEAKISGDKEIGKGEQAALMRFEEGGADAIVSDDRQFISYLKTKGIPFLLPTTMVLLAVQNGWLEPKVAEDALEKMRPFVRYANYASTKRAIRGPL